MAAIYADVLAKNLRAARARKGLDQEFLAARMRALGYSTWRRQTVASVERGNRRLTAEEILGLAAALETSMAALLVPATDDKLVALPSGKVIPAESIQRSLHYVNDGAVRWHDNEPQFSDGSLPEIGDVFRQIMTPFVAAVPPEQQKDAVARLEQLVSAMKAHDVGALFAEMPPEIREMLLAALNQKGGGS